MKPGRLLVAALLVVATAALVRAASHPRGVHAIDIASLPYRVNAWHGREAGALDAETLRILAADTYLNRNYTADSSAAPLNLYVAYYGEQRPGVSIHSPLHCLPGTGWETLDVATVDAPWSGGRMRRLLVRKNRDRAVVLYWYAIHGRMLASEVASKAWLLHDSLRFGRSDAALVRIVVPVAPAADAQTAEVRGISFVRDVLPYLQQLWS